MVMMSVMMMMKMVCEHDDGGAEDNMGTDAYVDDDDGDDACRHFIRSEHVSCVKTSLAYYYGL